jgi:Adenylate and Guanylate cyclase catalytic domain
VSVSRAGKQRPPLDYISKHLAEKILTARASLEGERKQVTIFFADIKDSTRLIEGLDPEAAQQLLDPAIYLMMDAVPCFEGTVNQVLGDGIMALFGAPIAHEDHALRACYAALALQSAVRPYYMQLRLDRLPHEEKRLLQTAAVIGTEVPLLLLQAIAELPEDALDRGLAHLQAAEFLYETRLFPEREYTFKHALTYEVAYSSLLLERRRQLHARIVEALEALAGEWVAEQALTLARAHQERGNEAYALRLLGEIAARREPAEHDQARDCYHAAMVLAEELGMRPLQAHCHLGLGTLYVKIDQRETARAELSAAIDLYRAMDMIFWLPQTEAALAQIT